MRSSSTVGIEKRKFEIERLLRCVYTSHGYERSCDPDRRHDIRFIRASGPRPRERRRREKRGKKNIRSSGGDDAWKSSARTYRSRDISQHARVAVHRERPGRPLPRARFGRTSLRARGHCFFTVRVLPSNDCVSPTYSRHIIIIIRRGLVFFSYSILFIFFSFSFFFRKQYIRSGRPSPSPRETWLSLSLGLPIVFRRTSIPRCNNVVVRVASNIFLPILSGENLTESLSRNDRRNITTDSRSSSAHTARLENQSSQATTSRELYNVLSLQF